MRLPMLTRAVSVAAVSAAAALTLCGAASAATTAARPVHTMLQISAAKSGIYKGQKDVIRGRLTNLRDVKRPLANEVVVLDKVVGKKLVAVGSAKTNAKGWVSYTVKPAANTRYELVFAGVAKKFTPSHSRIITVTVRHR